MAYDESNMQSEFNRWLRHNWEGKAAAFELKICKKPSLPFNRVEPHQEQALLDVKHGVLAYKISDSGIGFKPFDCFVMSDCPAYLAIMFYVPRANKRACLIDIDDWMKFKRENKNKSITEEQAEALAIQVIDLNNIEIT